MKTSMRKTTVSALLTGLLLLASPLSAQASGTAAGSGAVSPFVFQLMVFVMAIFVGYYVVWSVTPALHTPLMSVTNAISSVIVVGALLAVAVQYAEPAAVSATAATPAASDNFGIARFFGLLALIMAAVNIFGGFLVTQRMLAMYKKKDK